MTMWWIKEASVDVADLDTAFFLLDSLNSVDTFVCTSDRFIFENLLPRVRYYAGVLIVQNSSHSVLYIAVWKEIVFW